MSDFIPNSFQTPNAYVDRFMHLLTGDECKVLLYAVRRILGFHKEREGDHISLAQFERGKRDRYGNQLDHGTGLSRPTIMQALGRLIEFKLIIEVAPNDKSVNLGATYTLQLDADEVDISALAERTSNRQQRDTKRTVSARQKAKETRSVPQTTPGQSHRPPPVSPIDHPPVSPIDHPPVSPIDHPRSVPLTTFLNTEIQGEIQQGNPVENQTHTHVVEPVAARPRASKERVCVCGLTVSIELLERYARNQTPPLGTGWINAAWEGCTGHAFVEVWLERRAAPARATPLLDPAQCPDCEGRGLYYPDGPRGGVRKCPHARLLAQLQQQADAAARGSRPN